MLPNQKSQFTHTTSNKISKKEQKLKGSIKMLSITGIAQNT